MNERNPTGSVNEEDTLALLRQAFTEFRTRCFWFMRPDFVPTQDDLPRIAEGLRLYGGRSGWMMAARLCR